MDSRYDDNCCLCSWCFLRSRMLSTLLKLVIYTHPRRVEKIERYIDRGDGWIRAASQQHNNNNSTRWTIHRIHVQRLHSLHFLLHGVLYSTTSVSPLSGIYPQDPLTSLPKWVSLHVSQESTGTTNWRWQVKGETITSLQLMTKILDNISMRYLLTISRPPIRQHALVPMVKVYINKYYVSNDRAILCGQMDGDTLNVPRICPLLHEKIILTPFWQTERFAEIAHQWSFRACASLSLVQ